jgi:hypothetical protein
MAQQTLIGARLRSQFENGPQQWDCANRQAITVKRWTVDFGKPDFLGAVALPVTLSGFNDRKKSGFSLFHRNG